MSTEQTIKKIDPKYGYNLAEILRLEFFPHIVNIITVRRLVERDKANENILEAKVSRRGVGTRYQIRGENIIKFIKKYNAGLELRRR